jgi:hypothetical protein
MIIVKLDVANETAVLQHRSLVGIQSISRNDTIDF